LRRTRGFSVGDADDETSGGGHDVQFQRERFNRSQGREYNAIRKTSEVQIRLRTLWPKNKSLPEAAQREDIPGKYLAPAGGEKWTPERSSGGET